jgi:DnaJ-class molecular chaperone
MTKKTNSLKKKKFMQLQEAYECLNNPETRDLYDRGGVEAVKNGHTGGEGGIDLSDLLFGGGRGKARGPVKAKAKLKDIKVKLEEVYKGKMMSFEHSRKRTCTDCSGKGGANVKSCGTCKGKKMVTKLVQLGPGMYSQSTQHCPECKGEG